MATPWSKTHRSGNHTFRKFRDGDHRWPDLESQIFEADHSHKCPTYVHRTPPCQGAARRGRTCGAGFRSCGGWRSRPRA